MIKTSEEQVEKGYVTPSIEEIQKLLVGNSERIVRMIDVLLKNLLKNPETKPELKEGGKFGEGEQQLSLFPKGKDEPQKPRKGMFESMDNALAKQTPPKPV
ncbi:MAG: hypothetical protein JW855_05615 [Gammaproteobacteria bacterium]|nr:hypothetical protein [Gammaproteobacteria bacterium]